MKVIRITPGLGNQMFQYSLLLNYKLGGEEVYFDLSPCKHIKKHNSYELERIFNIKIREVSFWNKFKLVGPSFYVGSREITLLKLINKVIEKLFGEEYTFNSKNYIFEKEANQEFNFNSKYLELSGDKYISGYFNSYKYFENIQAEVRKVFTFREILESDQQNFATLNKIRNSESISIHVRRGDYVGSNLDVCDLDYYKHAVAKVLVELENRKVDRNKIKFFIFSDDINWCKSNFEFLGEYNTMYIDWNKGQNSYKDMQLMSRCQHNIIPNSTFSWWGAWLNQNQNKIVIVPEYWFKGVKNSDDRHIEHTSKLYIWE